MLAHDGAEGGGGSPLPVSCWTHLSCQRSSPLHEVCHRQHGKGPVGILRQAAIANLGKAPQALEREERMFDLGAHARLAPIGFLVGIGQRRIPISTLVGEVLDLGGGLLEPLPLNFTPVGAGAVDQARLAVRPDMQLHALGQQQFADLGEQGGAQLVLLQQVPEVEQGRGIGYPLASEVDAAEVAERRNAVEGAFAGLVRQVEPVGDAVTCAASAPGRVSGEDGDPDAVVGTVCLS